MSGTLPVGNRAVRPPSGVTASTSFRTSAQVFNVPSAATTSSVPFVALMILLSVVSRSVRSCTIDVLL